MTPDTARSLADEFQTRADHMGDRTAEGVHLGRAASGLRDLAAQLDDIDGLTARIACLTEKARLEAENAKAAEVAAVADTEVPVILDTDPIPVDHGEKFQDD